MYSPWDAAEAHAFDMPFEVMKSFRKEIAELKAGFQAEQQQRAVEIQQLRQEVFSLKQQLVKESAERTEICHQTVQDLTQLRSDKLKAIEELKVTFTNAITHVNQLLQDEVRDRKNSDSLRDTRENAEKSERQAENGQMKDDISKHKSVFFGSRDDLMTKINDNTHDIDVISTAMQKVSKAKATLTPEHLHCYRFFDGSAALSTTGGSR